MLRGKLNSAALPLARSSLKRIIESVRRLLVSRPVSERESPPTSRMFSRPSCAQSGHPLRDIDGNGVPVAVGPLGVPVGCVGDEPVGLVEGDGKTLKTPAVAYGQVEDWLVGATMTSCGSDDSGIWTCEITRPENYRAWTVWNPDRTVSFSVPATWKVTEIRDLSGRSRALGKAKAIDIGPAPLLLVAPGS